MHSISLFIIAASLSAFVVAKPTYSSNVQDDAAYRHGRYNDNDNYGDYPDYMDDSYYGDEDVDDTTQRRFRKPCKCDCEKTPIYEMDDACRRKCIKPAATTPCTTPTPTPTKPCTTGAVQPTSMPGMSPNQANVSPDREQRPICTATTVTKTVDHFKTDTRTVTNTATTTVVRTETMTSVKVVPTTIVNVKTATVDHTATVTKTCIETSTVHDVQYRTVTKEVYKTVTVGAQPTQEAQMPCHECEANSDYGEKPHGNLADNASKPAYGSYGGY
jgi:hypothetical protein